MQGTEHLSSSTLFWAKMTQAELCPHVARRCGGQGRAASQHKRWREHRGEGFLEKGPHCARWPQGRDPGRSNRACKGLEATVTAGWAGWAQLEGGVRDSEEARRRPLLPGGPHPLGHRAGKRALAGCPGVCVRVVQTALSHCRHIRLLVWRKCSRDQLGRGREGRGHAEFQPPPSEALAFPEQP
ncbi:unnamed protein product [Rangifer tarandus platyrhynchus]|uniref:Uncharacterized protein n=2 Tax=Rangifer tarandus platyrhynchus TaxID=3082113 RepID=A0AC59ZR64_RANTA|nr:unnamed protein product [Rangifer tarandus platyrhynchus]